ncbi:MAG: hypothetical protein IIZ39_08350, partial [Blautia sp.]|nr:hypothetical protein [Blautia sp.]
MKEKLRFRLLLAVLLCTFVLTGVRVFAEGWTFSEEIGLDESLPEGVLVEEKYDEAALAEIPWDETVSLESVSEDVASESNLLATDEQNLFGEEAVAEATDDAPDAFSLAENGMDSLTSQGEEEPPARITLSDAALSKLHCWKYEEDDYIGEWNNEDVHLAGDYIFEFHAPVEIYGAHDLDFDLEDRDDDDDSNDLYVYEFTVANGDPVSIEDISHRIHIPEDIYGGTITADKSSARAGDTVTLTATPKNENYTLDKLTVKQGKTKIDVVNGKFTMPDGDVTVHATFKASAVPAEPLHSTEGLAPKHLTGISGTTTSSSESYQMLFDDRTDTKWCVVDHVPCFVEFECREAFLPQGYSLTTANDNESEKGRNPSTWTLEARNSEGEAWTSLSEVIEDTTMADVNFTRYDFAIHATTAYRYYRLTITATQGAKVMQLSEFRLWGAKSEGSFHVSLPQEVTGGSITPGLTKESFSEGESVPLTLTPAQGYRFGKCTVTR